MSMSEPLVPHTDHDAAPAAAEPGPGAPGTPLDEQPDILPDAVAAAEDQTNAADPADTSGATDAARAEDPPFRTPAAGDKLSPDELEDRI